MKKKWDLSQYTGLMVKAMGGGWTVPVALNKNVLYREYVNGLPTASQYS